MLSLEFTIRMNEFGYVKISEGTGDNLLREDIDEGYVDYINYEIYDTYYDYLEDNSDDGGMALLKNPYQDFRNNEDVVSYMIYEDIFPNKPWEFIKED